MFLADFDCEVRNRLGKMKFVSRVKRLGFSDWISLVALIVSFLSLAYVVYQGEQAKEEKVLLQVKRGHICWSPECTLEMGGDFCYLDTDWGFFLSNHSSMPVSVVKFDLVSGFDGYGAVGMNLRASGGEEIVLPVNLGPGESVALSVEFKMPVPLKVLEMKRAQGGYSKSEDAYSFNFFSMFGGFDIYGNEVSVRRSDEGVWFVIKEICERKPYRLSCTTSKGNVFYAVLDPYRNK